MTLKELGATLAGWRTSRSSPPLWLACMRKEQAGIYRQFDVRAELPIQLLIKYFSKVGDMWQDRA